MPNLFLSAAVGDDDHYVDQFFRDLRRQVSTLTGEPERDSAFLGTAPNASRAWPHSMAVALGRCDVFVALCSPRYFMNEVCGKQWWVFNDRLHRYEKQTGVRPPALVALAWTPTDAVPALASQVVPPSEDAPRRGLRQFVRLQTLRDSYHAFVADLADKIVMTARDHPLPRSEPIPELASTPSAFTLADLRSQRGGTGSPHVHFVIAAGSREEMDKVRENLVFYGDEAEDWSPYLPALPEPLAEHAQSLAADQLLESGVGGIDDVVNRIERARRDNEIVVVLVDWWTTQLDSYQRVLAEIDRRGLDRTAVLVPASRTDEETAQNRDELRFGLRRTFRNTATRPDPMFRAEIATPDGFDSDLAGVIEEARNRIFREGQVHHLPPGDPPGDRPILRGP
jgi:FxsC-like protein